MTRQANSGQPWNSSVPKYHQRHDSTSSNRGQLSLLNLQLLPWCPAGVRSQQPRVCTQQPHTCFQGLQDKALFDGTEQCRAYQVTLPSMTSIPGKRIIPNRIRSEFRFGKACPSLYIQMQGEQKINGRKASVRPVLEASSLRCHHRDTHTRVPAPHRAGSGVYTWD